MNESVITLLSYAIKQYGMDRTYSLSFARHENYHPNEESPVVFVYEDNYSESAGIEIAKFIMVNGAIEQRF